jgi:hypothetical protein
VSDGIGGLLDPDQMGRGGGIVGMAVGLILLSAATYFTISTTSERGVWLWPFGILGGLLVFAAGLVGYRRGVEKARVPEGMPLAALRTMVEAQALGFWVCTRCRVIMPRTLTGECLECGSGVDCLEVATETDRKVALAAIPRE